MAHPMTLPALAGLAILAAGAGVQLGLGAVAEMDGAQSEAVETRSFASLTPHRSTGGAHSPLQDQAQGVSRMEIGVGDLGGCYGYRCGPGYYRDEPVDDYAAAALPSPYEDPAPEVEAPPLPVDESAPPPAVDDMERYARYPVTTQEAEESDGGEAMVDRW